MFYLLFLSWSMGFSKYFSTHSSEYLTRLEMITFTTLKNKIPRKVNFWRINAIFLLFTQCKFRNYSLQVN